MLQVSLYRYSPEADEAPKMQDFRVDTGGKDLMVLDVRVKTIWVVSNEESESLGPYRKNRV